MEHGCGRCWYEYDRTHGGFVEKGGRRGDLQVEEALDGLIWWKKWNGWMMKMRKIGCELGCNDGEVDNGFGYVLGHCEDKSDMCRIGNRCRYVQVDGNGSKLRQSEGDLGIRGFA